MNRLLCFAAAVFLVGCTSGPLPESSLALDDLLITVQHPSRELGYTNKQAGFYYTETGADHRTGWQGWHIMARKMLDDYRIEVDGAPLRKTDARQADVLPHQFSRSYPSGIVETVTLLDSIDAILVELRGVRGKSVRFTPMFDQSLAASDYAADAGSGTLVAALKRHLVAGQSTLPAWIGAALDAVDATPTADTASVLDHRRFGPGSVRITDAPAEIACILTAAPTADLARKLLSAVAEKRSVLVTARKNRMQRVLDAAPFRSNNERFDRAMAWATLSMDALIMNQVRVGIFAGLPWFNNYWGRDSFISLPGATLVTGRFTEAKEILRSFADWQEKNGASPNEGRIPNLVTTTSTSYNTADGTPWFVSALQQYITMSGDTSFGAAMYPVVRRSVEGSLRHHTDRYRFLVHGDAETWMDAVGPDGPWSPRGNRACDVQALWVRQLIAASAIARSVGDDASADRWETVVDTVIQNFSRMFIDRSSNLVFDHLTPDGTPNRQLRPNQLFAFEIVQDPAVRVSMFKTVTEQMAYPYGVGSLSPAAEKFHPYHHYEPYYVQDAAYHQGIVWTWLYGRWAKIACGFGLADLAFTMTDNMVHQILDRGAVGTLSELLDAAPRPGEREPRLSGTFSQAWSLAEFIRTAYQSYAGITTNVPDRQVWVYPRLPKQMSHVQCTVPFGAEKIVFDIHSSGNTGILRINTSGCTAPVSFMIGWPFGNRVGRTCTFELQPGHQVRLEITEDNYEMAGYGADPVPVQTTRQDISPDPQLVQLQLASPVVREGLKALKGPGYPLLQNRDIKSANPAAAVLLDREDPSGDDRGNGSYVYPRSVHFRPGCLDLTRVRITADEKNVYVRLNFRDLADPGWHPEYGFQLTYAALCIDADGVAGSGRTKVGRNSNYTLPPQAAAEYVVFVGGGLRLEDASGAVVAEYRPAAGDESNPLGSTAQREISFSLPRSLFATAPERWRFTVVVGAQDDHGGAGIGDFRSVEATAAEWTGGGKRHPSESNVYDVLVP